MIRETLQDAVAHHRAGRLEQAARLYEDVLRIDPGHPDAWHLLGVIDHQQGKHRQAAERITRAISANPGAPSYYSNLGAVCRALGEPDKAVSHCRRALRISADFADAHNNLGNALADRGEFAEAAASFRQVLRIQPDHVDALDSLGSALKNLGQLQESETCYRRIVELQPDCGKALHNLGNLLQGRGELAEAETCYRRALRIKPDDVAALNNLGNLLIGRKQLDDAETCYRRALEIDPNRAYSCNGLGAVFQRRKMPEEAISHYRRALEIWPDYVDALANLAGLLENLNRQDEAAAIAARCLRLAPDHPMANVAAATCERRQGRFCEAIERLERLQFRLPPHSGAAKEVQFELAQLHDRAGQPARAFACAAEANRLAVQELRQKAFGKKDRYLQMLRALRYAFTKTWVESWSPAPPCDDAQTPVFLVGFPRSGTTLLRVVLDSHPGVHCVEEKPTVETLYEGVQGLPGRYPQSLADLTPQTIESLRSAYFGVVDRYVDRRSGKLLVDKYPLNVAEVGLILRIFPKARFIVAVRHPCDVCLSCFMQNFEINDAMANFLTLEDTAKLYDRVMRLWRQYVRVLPHPYHLVRYEDLVDDFEGESRRLLQFLGVGWNDSVRRYTDHAKKKDWIHTPSYQQVVEPIYRRARYRWERYTEQLRPIMSVLEPHVEYFGYQNSRP